MRLDPLTEEDEENNRELNFVCVCFVFSKQKKRVRPLEQGREEKRFKYLLMMMKPQGYLEVK